MRKWNSPHMNRSLRKPLSLFFNGLSRAFSFTLLLFVEFYRTHLSVYFGRSCKFYPSCSEYAVVALKSHSFYRALSLIGIRVCRCHPFRSYSVDFVPQSGRSVLGGSNPYAEQSK